jgi:hypothetical protein
MPRRLVTTDGTAFHIRDYELPPLGWRFVQKSTVNLFYDHILYDGEQHVAMASLDGMTDRTVTINSVSKTFSVTGWRVGWTVAPADLTGGIRKVHDFLTVGAAPLPQDNKPKLSLCATAKNSVRLTVSGPPGYYIISMSEDLRTWVDIYPVTIEASGVGNVDDSGGPLLYSHLFYRVRLEP